MYEEMVIIGGVLALWGIAIPLVLWSKLSKSKTETLHVKSELKGILEILEMRDMEQSKSTKTTKRQPLFSYPRY